MLEIGNSFGACIDVELIVANETQERHAAIKSELYSQAGRCSHGSQNWSSGMCRFLDKFETCSAADENNALAEWKRLCPATCADDLVQCVVSAHVFTKEEKIAVDVEQS